MSDAEASTRVQARGPWAGVRVGHSWPDPALALDTGRRGHVQQKGRERGT